MSKKLSNRELQVLKCLCCGMDNHELCDELSMSMATVKTHLSSMYKKVGARDRLQLVIYAFCSGLVPLDIQSKIRPPEGQ